MQHAAGDRQADVMRVVVGAHQADCEILREVELGRGSANLPNLLGRLTEFDYRGWVTIERQDSHDPITEIGNAVAFLRAL